MAHPGDQTVDPATSPVGSRTSVDDLIALEVLFHPHLARIGDRAVLGPASSDGAAREVLVGRDEPQFVSRGLAERRPIADPCISRRQLTVRWVRDRQQFEVRSEADARRPVRLFDAAGRPLPEPPRLVPPGSIIAVGDRLLLLCARRPADVTAPELGLVGHSEPMVSLRAQIRALCDSDDTVLVTGETGVGKELVARALHDGSRRRREPFLAVNCAALPEALLESELFGHVKGAFSGAHGAREGIFRGARRGTVFLDEIGELPQMMQAKLLRVLQERAVRAVGDTEERPFEARIVAATNRDLSAEVAEGRFRADLFSRLEAPQVAVPPLRARASDVPALFVHFLAQRVAATKGPGKAPAAWLLDDPGVHPPPVPADFMRSLLAHPFPRNVRELEKLVAQVATLNASPGPFRAPELSSAPPEPQRISAPPSQPDGDRASRPKGPLGEDELVQKLEEHDHVQHRVAKALGISRTTLDKWLRDLGIRRPKDIPRGDVERELEASGGDLEAAARALKVSVRGLKLRMTELGLGEARR